MTGAVLIKSAAMVCVAGAEVAMTVVAVIDPSVANLVSVGVGAIVTIVMGWFALKATLASLNKKVDAQADKLDQTLRKTEVIEGHVNSEKTKAAGEIESLQKENKLLREVMADKKETAALLAQSVATQPLAVVLPVIPAVPPAKTDTLNQIEKHTKDTAANTARTEADVQEIKAKQ